MSHHTSHSQLSGAHATSVPGTSRYPSSVGSSPPRCGCACVCVPVVCDIAPRIVCNRFQGLTAGCELNSPWWEVDEFARVYLCLESDWFHGKSFAERLRIRPGPPHTVAENGGPTSERRLTLEDRSSLRSSCTNAVVISAVVLSDPLNHRLCEAVNVIAGPLKSWHAHQNRILRSCPESLEWVKSQAAGTYMDHICEIVSGLTEVSGLERMGFATHLRQVNKISEDDIGLENEVASLVGNFCMTMVKNRARRRLWMTSSWPFQFHNILNGEDKAAQRIARFKEDVRIFRALEALPSKAGRTKICFSRHVFQKLTNQHLMLTWPTL